MSRDYKSCKNCSLQFTPVSVKQVFCSKTCKGKFKYTSGSVTTTSQYEKISGNWTRYLNRLLITDGRRRDNLTVEILLKVLDKQDYKCALTNLKLTCLLEVGKDFKTNASVDRIEAGGPYIEDNIQIVCKAVNKFRGNLSVEEFIWWCKKVVENAE